MANAMEQLLYYVYKAQGGKLEYQAWVNAGKPPADTKTLSTVSGSTTPTTRPWTQNTVPATAPSTPVVPTTPPSPQQETITFTGMYPDRNGNPRALRGSDGKYYYPDGFTMMSDADIYNLFNIANREASQFNNPTDPNAITPYQQGSLDLQRQQFAWQQSEAQKQFAWQQSEAQRETERQQAEARNKEWQAQYNLQSEASQSAIQKQQNEMELIKGRAFPFGDEAGRRRMLAETSAAAFESARQSILGSLSSPSDWIKRWEVQNAPNPYTQQPQSRVEQKQTEVENSQTRIYMFNQMADAADELVAQLSTNPDYGAGTPNEATVLTQARNDAINYRNAAKAEGDKLGAWQTDLTYLQGEPQHGASSGSNQMFALGKTIEQPGTRVNAPAPSWLPMFAPGQRAGQAITRENVATPSAQQWAATPWSAQQGLSGYLDWAGYRTMADVLGNMAQMLPNSPGGGSRWSPYIGR